jgi:hypothetical protein
MAEPQKADTELFASATHAALTVGDNAERDNARLSNICIAMVRSKGHKRASG